MVPASLRSSASSTPSSDARDITLPWASKDMTSCVCCTTSDIRFREIPGGEHAARRSRAGVALVGSALRAGPPPDRRQSQRPPVMAEADFHPGRQRGVLPETELPRHLEPPPHPARTHFRRHVHFDADLDPETAHEYHYETCLPMAPRLPISDRCAVPSSVRSRSHRRFANTPPKGARRRGRPGEGPQEESEQIQEERL